MKMIIEGQSIFSVMVNLIIFCGSSLPVLAENDRYPTDAEVQQLRQEFHQKTVPQTRQLIKEGRGYGRDKRIASDLENRASFIRAWSRVDS